MDYRETPVTGPLAASVRCWWSLSSPAVPAGAAEPALPDGSPELILNLGDPFEHRGLDGRTRRQPAAFLVGQITRPMTVRPTGRVDLIALRLEAHGAAVLLPDVSRLTDDWAPLRALGHPGVTPLLQALRRSPDPAARALILEHWYAERAASARAAADAAVVAAVQGLRASHGGASLDALCARLGTTPRTLQRRFRAQVGISPKLLARILRFQRVFHVWQREPRRL
ncbi:MAG: hypothetical protein KA180_16495, partial [Gemmatimonadales bacterium]|nr:hypothetical protein [Gemmatimonadales bacterium]